MKDHLMILTAMGAATLVMAWLPSLAKKIKISYPIILILIGFGLFYLQIPLNWPDPIWPDTWVMKISEAIVIISLMGAGLKIDRLFSWKQWRGALQLILITMPLFMLSVLILGMEFLHFSLPASILLAAVMAPTDPVLAEEVQLSGPQKDNEEDTHLQFTLTAEAGINDGFAFPFTYMAILVAQAGSWANFELGNWMLYKVLIKITLGILIGFIVGRIVGYLLEKLPTVASIRTRDGFLALSTTFFVYGLTELLYGYGFLAVFVAGLTIRRVEIAEGDFKNKMHNFVGEIERFLLVFWLVLFGGSLLNGVLENTDWKGIVMALLIVLVIRPITGMIGLTGTKISFQERLGISFLGIRGIGSIFYLAWAFSTFGDFTERGEMYAITSMVILFSIVIHGLTAPHIIGYIERHGKNA